MAIIIAGYADFDMDDVSELLQTAREHIEGAYTEKGCIHYIWTADPFVPGRLHVYEEWVEEADLAAHFSDHWYKDMGAHLAKYPRKDAKFQKYRVDLIEPVYDPTGTPRADFFTA